MTDLTACVLRHLTAGDTPNAIIAEVRAAIPATWCLHRSDGYGVYRLRAECAECVTRAVMAKIDSTQWQAPAGRGAQLEMRVTR